MKKTLYNKRIANNICKWIADGSTIIDCADKLGITRKTIYEWLDKHDDFARKIEKARIIQAHNFVDEMRAIADDASNDLIDQPSGHSTPNPAAVSRAQLRIKTREKLAGYFAPKVFGQQAATQINVAGNAYFGGLVITPPKLAGPVEQIEEAQVVQEEIEDET